MRKNKNDILKEPLTTGNIREWMGQAFRNQIAAKLKQIRRMQQKPLLFSEWIKFKS